MQCEILPVACAGGRVLYLRRASAYSPWWVEVAPGRHPSQIVAQALARQLGAVHEPPHAIVHSTSWRYDASCLSLVLSYVVILSGLRQPPTGFVLEPVEAPKWDAQTGTYGGHPIRVSDVLLHGLEHFALLRFRDPAIAAALPDEWHTALTHLAPLPAGLLDHYLPQSSDRHLTMIE